MFKFPRVRPNRENLVKPEIYSYPSFDKTPIEATPDRHVGQTNDAKLPLVVFIHGGPTGRWADGFDTFGWARLLASRGYLVFCPNIRGSTEYGWSSLTRNRADWGGNDFKDVMAGVDELIAPGDC